MMNQAEIKAALVERGWVTLDLPNPAEVFAVRDALLTRLRATSLPELERLDDYHRWTSDDERHIAVLYDLSTYYWDEQHGRSIVLDNLELFRALIGPQLHIQRRPYLRAVRPGHPADAAPMHRDTYYGASPHEVSIVVPFTDIEAADAIRVISGSHRSPDSDYPYTQHHSETVEIRSPRHRLGFPYAPKLLDPAVVERAEPVPLTVGQVLVFGLSLVHGGGVNSSERTRFSSDIRLVDSLAPVPWSRGVDEHYFVPLCAGPIISTTPGMHVAADSSG